MDELVNRLRLAQAVLSRNKDLIALLSDAAEAIEELSKQHEAQQENIVVLLDIIENDRNEIEWLKKCVNDLPKADVVSGRDFRDCRNELCLKCGAYTERHKGACEGCRWKG